MSFIDPEEKEIGFSPLPKKGLDNLAKCEFLSTEPINNPCHGFSVSETHTNNSVHGASDGSINITVNGGKSPYSYSWSNGATTQDIGSLAAGTYSVTVTDDNQCEASISVEITQPLNVPSYSNCFSSYLPVDSEGRIYAIQIFGSAGRQDATGGGIRMLGGVGGAGAEGPQNNNNFGNGEFGGGEPFGVDDTRSNKEYSPIASYGSGWRECRSFYVLLKDSNVPGAENAPYSVESPVAGEPYSVGIPNTFDFLYNQPHWWRNAIDPSYLGSNFHGMLVPPGWRISVYTFKNFTGCDKNWRYAKPNVRYEADGPVYFHDRYSLPYEASYSNDCGWDFFKNVTNISVTEYQPGIGWQANRGTMPQWHYDCARFDYTYPATHGGYSYAFTKIPL